MNDIFKVILWEINKVFYICLKNTTFTIAFFSSFLFTATFPEYREIRSKKKITDHQTANTIQLFVAIKENISGLFFFLTSRCEDY